MQDRNPHQITDLEWQEIAAVPAVREAWGLTDDVTTPEFASVVYGAKFNFLSGGPGYSGDLFLLQGDAITEAAPIVLRRNRDGHLIVC